MRAVGSYGATWSWVAVLAEDEEARIGFFHLILWMAGGLEVGNFYPSVIFLVLFYRRLPHS